MQAIYDFFTTIGNLISTFITDVINFIKLIGMFVKMIPTWFSWLPSSIVALLGTAFAIVIVLQILGRE